jgi:hypothetical protein
MPFDQWIAALNTRFSKYYGVEINDVEDWNWSEYYDDDYSEAKAQSSIADAIADWSYDHGQSGNPENYQ